jgi:hypothetical protein
MFAMMGGYGSFFEVQSPVSMWFGISTSGSSYAYARAMLLPHKE